MEAAENITVEAIKALGVGPLVHEAYKDVLQPAARQIGDDLLVVAKAVSVALAPLEAAVWGYDRLKEWLAITVAQKLAFVPPGQVGTPTLNVAGPAIANMRLSMDQRELRDMYANLVVSSMMKNRSGYVHPSFAYMIQQMTADEAKLIKKIAEKETSCICSETTSDTYTLNESVRIADTLSKLAVEAGLEYPGNIEAYMDNLIRLNILNEKIYEQGKYVHGGANRYGDYEPSIENIETREIVVSKLGESFIVCCLREISELA